ncbi:hypothetical protein [Tropicimonas sp. S265A]|uniref:hypothetical protein n=1 Tax=Tropicimonas sp. S265A TaxID=3415134 RepID=UPI003C7C4395
MYRRGVYTGGGGVAIGRRIGNASGMARDQTQTLSHVAPDLDTFLRASAGGLGDGPVALIFAEDGIELASTLQHHLDKGFRTVVMLGPAGLQLPEALAARIHRVRFQPGGREAVADAVTRIAARLPGTWIYWGYNAEYLIYPHAETRTVGEMLAFHAEERREGMMTYVVDLYAADLGAAPNGVSLDACCLDKAGYYMLDRYDGDGARLDRQYDIFGGLRWRFEEHVAEDARRIDRIGLFRAKPGLTLRPDFTFSDSEYNTVSCAWHHNLTAAICSFRAAKALKANPGSTHLIPSFRWQHSVPFEWSSQQLLELGFIEPGQWF